MDANDRGIVGRIGPLEVDWPRTLGYFGGAAAAVAFGVIEAPLGIAIAAVPFVKMLNNPRATLGSHVVGHVFEGAMKPIGGDAEGTIRLTTGGTGARSRSSPGRRTARRGPSRRTRGRSRRS